MGFLWSECREGGGFSEGPCGQHGKYPTFPSSHPAPGSEPAGLQTGVLGTKVPWNPEGPQFRNPE